MEFLEWGRGMQGEVSVDCVRENVLQGISNVDRAWGQVNTWLF